MLNIYFHRKFSGFIAAGSAVVAISGGIGLVKAGNSMPVIVQLVGWLVILLMIWGIIAGLRQLRKPPLMYSADRRGVMIYYAADRVSFTGNRVFLPWTLVSGMALEKRIGSGANSKRVYTWVIACALEDNAPFPVQQHSVAYKPQDGERVVCLDAFTGTVTRQAMLEQLQSLWQASIRGRGCPAGGSGRPST